MGNSRLDLLKHIFLRSTQNYTNSHMKYSNAFWLRDWLDSAHFHSFNKLNMKFFRQNIRLKNIKINKNIQYKKKKKIKIIFKK